MQDNYVGDIGDYGKYGLLRMIGNKAHILAVNWYMVKPPVTQKQNDGKYIGYLEKPEKYRAFDPALFDALYQIVMVEKNRSVDRIEQADLFPAALHSVMPGTDRSAWHQNALTKTAGCDTVFLDPDNGLETERMHLNHSATEKHVRWDELRDYYDRGQNVILYQHRPQMTSKARCIDAIMKFQQNYLHADTVFLLEFPQFTNRFYFIFSHKKHAGFFESICGEIEGKLPGFCRWIKP